MLSLGIFGNLLRGKFFINNTFDYDYHLYCLFSHDFEFSFSFSVAMAYITFSGDHRNKFKIKFMN